ncbi:hypothetical protein AMTRI_Chr08g203590 [Amborella trichopoda]
MNHSPAVRLLCCLLLVLVMAEENQQTELTPSEPTDQTRPVLDAVVQGEPQRFFPRGHGAPRAKGWPEVVELSVEEAEKKIKADMPMVQLQVVKPDYFVTMDYDLRRVRLYVDATGIVVKTPALG